MQYRRLEKLNKEISVLGYGAMRFPLYDGDPGNVKEEEAIALIRHAIDKGVNYVDTAYNYHKGKSEVIVGKALKDGYREKTSIATKMPVWLPKCHEDFEKYFLEQLTRLDVEDIDFYLLHNLNRKYWPALSELDVLSFLNRVKTEGRVKHVGFSFHDELELFKEIIDAYEWDFCQIQLNFMGEDFQAGIEGMKYAESKGIPVFVMEPLLGGKLAKEPPADIAKIWNKAEIKRSPAEWALRWVLDHQEISMLLSGMNTFEQIDENVETLEKAVPGSLTSEEFEIIDEVKRTYTEKIKINCTDCGYCRPCPKGVWIPYNFTLYNEYHVYETVDYSKDMYNRLEKSAGAASACVACGECEKKCPQDIKIIEELKRVHQLLASEV